MFTQAIRNVILIINMTDLETADLSHLHEMEITSIIKIIIIPNENKEDIGKHPVFVV
jgi:hypothetical protein